MGRLDIGGQGLVDADQMRVGGDGVYVDFNFGVNTRPGSAAPDRVDLNATDIEVLVFDGVNTTEELSASFELDHNWKEGTTIYPHVHWFPTTTAAGTVVWQMELVFVNRTATGAIGASSSTIRVEQAAGGVAWGAQFANFPEVDMTGFLIGTQVFVRFFRDPTDGNDDYGADAGIATFGFHVQVDTLGSRQVAAK
jgi:hypothetical protein